MLSPTPFTLLYCFCLPAIVSASPPSPLSAAALIGDWTNGRITYYSEKVNDRVVQFYGGNLHEGGYEFAVGTKDDGGFYLLGRQFQETKVDSAFDPSFGKRGDKIILKQIGGRAVLIAEGADGDFREFLASLKPRVEIGQMIRADMVKFELAGRYIDSATGRQVVFWPNEPTAEGLAAETRYDFGTTPEDVIEDVLVFPDKKSYYYSRTDEGLDLYSAKEGNDGWDKGKKLLSLHQTYWFDLTGGKNLSGKYAFASIQILTDDITDLFTTAQLRILRNEIYARHGYIFKTPDMKSYFGAQPWYQPRFESVDDQLTDVERFNLLLIQHLPKRE